MSDIDCNAADLAGGPLGLEQLRADVEHIVQVYAVGRPTFEMAEAIGLEICTANSSILAWGEEESKVLTHLISEHLPAEGDIEDMTEREAQCMVAGVVMGGVLMLRELVEALAKAIPDKPSDLLEQAVHSQV